MTLKLARLIVPRSQFIAALNKINNKRRREKRE